MIDYNVRIIAFPNRSVPALVTPNDDGSFDIYINGLLTEEQQREALRHEIEHLERDHFYKDEPVAKMEAEANRKPIPKKAVTPPPPPCPPKTRAIRLYKSMKHMENYLNCIGALGVPIDYLSERRTQVL